MASLRIATSLDLNLDVVDANHLRYAFASSAGAAFAPIQTRVSYVLPLGFLNLVEEKAILALLEPANNRLELYEIRA